MNNRPPPTHFDVVQRRLAIVLLSIVLPVIVYIVYAQWIVPDIQQRQAQSALLDEEQVQAQIQATADADAHAALLAEAAQATTEYEIALTAERVVAAERTEEDNLRATLMQEARVIVQDEFEATQAADFIFQSTIAAQATAEAFRVLEAESTLASRVQATEASIAAQATLSAYKLEQDELIGLRVLATVQSAYQGEVVVAEQRTDNFVFMSITLAAAFVGGVVVTVAGLQTFAQPRRHNRRRGRGERAESDYIETPTERKLLRPEYEPVRCVCKGEQVLCYQCNGVGELLTYDPHSDRDLYAPCTKCRGSAYTACPICQGMGVYYREVGQRAGEPVDYR